MDTSVSSSYLWWNLLVRGIVTVLFGVAAVFWPQETLVILVYLFSAYILVMGVFELIMGVADAGRGGLWWLSLILGVLSVGVGVYLLRHPLASFATIILILGFTFVVRGVIDVVQGLFGSGKASGSRFLTVLVGALSFILGIIVLNQPVSSGVAFVWVIGIYALIAGPVLIALSLSEREALEAV